jgi:hypothetical protein
MSAADDTGRTVIETPCWVEGDATAADLERVHEWNAMMQMRHEADDADPATSATIGSHLTALCQRFRGMRAIDL